MSRKSVQRFFDNGMHEINKCMSRKSAQRFFDNDMHEIKASKRDERNSQFAARFSLRRWRAGWRHNPVIAA
ncbi:MAG: hypothetical protein ACK5KM_09475, partial [Hyphomicrobiaceae bacterium]